MYRKYEVEFAKIYKRLMALEITMKQNAINAISLYYGDNALLQFEKFFLHKNILKCYNDSKGNQLEYIVSNSNLSSMEKFKKLINVLYLTHLMRLTLTFEQFFKSEITSKFYFKRPEKYSLLKKRMSIIRDLRNDVAHYNFKNYEKNKTKYMEALIVFEIHIGCNIGRLEKIPEFAKVPTIREVLDKLYEFCPDLFNNPNTQDREYNYNKDRIIIDLFDDFAILGGWNTNDLPSPWTILRAKYSKERFLRKTKFILNPQKELSLRQLSLSFEQG